MRSIKLLRRPINGSGRRSVDGGLVDVSLGGYEVIKGAVCWEKPAVMNFS